jgi:hypothetical protein
VVGLSDLPRAAQFPGGLARTSNPIPAKSRKHETDTFARVAAAGRYSQLASGLAFHHIIGGEAFPEPGCLADTTSPFRNGLFLSRQEADFRQRDKGIQLAIFSSRGIAVTGL